MPHALFTILFSGLRYPTLATALGSLMVFGRFIYTMGYATGDPAKVCSLFSLQDVGLTALRNSAIVEVSMPSACSVSDALSYGLFVYLTNHVARSVRPDYLCCL